MADSAATEGDLEIVAEASAAQSQEENPAVDSAALPAKVARAFLRAQTVAAQSEEVSEDGIRARLLVGTSAIFLAAALQAAVVSEAAEAVHLGDHLVSVFRPKRMLKLSVYLTFRVRARASTSSSTSTFLSRSAAATPSPSSRTSTIPD